MYTKKHDDIAALIESGRRIGEVLENLAHQVQIGVSTSELDLIAKELIIKSGGQPAFLGYRLRASDPAYPGSICVSINDEVVHGIPSSKRIVKEGDLVSIDIGMVFQSAKSRPMFTDTALTVMVGKVSKEAEKLTSVTRGALEAGIAAARSGNTIASIGKAVQNFVQAQGNYGIVRDLVGHGVGHALHEDPIVPNYYDKDLEKWELKPGVVLALEPMITLGTAEVKTLPDGWTVATRDHSLCAHFEHTVIITDGDPIVVTRRPHEL